MREERTEVLVVGAGPVGLFAANLLADAGVEVQIIDSQPNTASRSYACALHSRSLGLLAGLGLSDALLAGGRKVDRLVFGDALAKRDQVEFSSLDDRFPFILIAAQSQLEGLLEQRLRQRHGLGVAWGHRFDSIQPAPDGAAVDIEELGGTGTGYVVPHWEAVVKRRSSLLARFVIGADGAQSLVRQRLGLKQEPAGSAASYRAYEFTAKEPNSVPATVIIDNDSTSVLWPLAQNRYRWTFQSTKSPADFPEKDRRLVEFERLRTDNVLRQRIQELAGKRAGWCAPQIEEILWTAEVSFRPWLVDHYGKGACWLAGDAAHQTGPVGAQSMNIGLAEAADLTTALRSILGGTGSAALLDEYDAKWRREWTALLGIQSEHGSTAPQPAAPTAGATWSRAHAAQICPFLPGSGGEWRLLAAQLGLVSEQNK